jgi:hypothetical protein
MESILTSIKKLLGIHEEDDAFDTDIIMHINSVLMILTDIGVGPTEGFAIEDDGATWEDFLGEGISYEAAKTYVYLKLRPVFDPPSSTAALEAINNQAKEYEWRLNVRAESEV